MDQAVFVNNWNRFNQQREASPHQRFAPNQFELRPILEDDTAQTGFDHHYIYHTAWATRELCKIMPPHHVDFGSSLYFVAMASAIVPLVFYDYRPPALRLPNLEVRAGDLLAMDIESASLPSVSCLHVIEHVGLGRYGDPVDFDGDLTAMRELGRVVAPGGSLLIAVPMGQPRVVYNAHRIYAFQQIHDVYADRFDLKEFSLILDGNGGLVNGASKDLADVQSYGCGCFHFVARG